MKTNVRSAYRLVSDMMTENHIDAAVWNLCFIDSSGQLVVGFDQGKVSPDIAARRLRDVVPDIPLRLGACSAQRHANKQDLNRPVIGGVIIRTPDVQGEGTVGIVDTLDSKLGIFTAGHVVEKVGTIVYQPRKSSQNDWEIGKATEVSNFSGNAKSDSAFVELKNGVTATPLVIWKSGSSTYTVTGKGPPKVGDMVFMQGATSQTVERSGKICSLNATVKFSDGGVLTEQYIANYLTKTGDSGAPVYIKKGGDNVTLIGLNVGGAKLADITADAPDPNTCPANSSGEYAVISAWENVEKLQ